MAESPQTILELYQTKYTDTSYKKVVNPVGTLSFRDFLMRYGVPKIFNNMQYIRHGGYVDVDMIFEDTEFYNYVAYNNGEGAGYEYAFIIKREFLNFNCTRLYLQYDVWANNVKKFNTLTQKVYTVRRHVDNTQVKDTVGYPEDIPLTFHYTGEYKAQIGGQFVVCICYSRAMSETSFRPVNAPCMPYDPMNYIFFSYDEDLNKNEPEESDFSDILNMLDSVYIVGAYMFKTTLNIGSGELITTRFKAGDDGVLKGFKLTSTLNGLSTNITFNIDSVLNESMMYNSQFTKYYITDGVSKKELRREIVGNGNSPTLTLDETYFIDNSGVYKRLEIPKGSITSPNSTNNFISSIGFKLPTYIDNVERADEINTIAMLTKIAGALYGGLTGSTAGAIMSNINSTRIDYAGNNIINLMEAEKNWYSFNDYGDFTATLSNTNQMGNSYILEYQGTDEQKQLLLDKWNAEGYIVNKILPLTIRSRKYYDYIKTKDLSLNITAPSEEVMELNEIFNRGVTIWHYTGDGIKYPNYVTNTENEVI